jgi:hypothetical protein
MKRYLRGFYVLAVFLTLHFYSAIPLWMSGKPFQLMWPVAWIFHGYRAGTVVVLALLFAASSVLVIYNAGKRVYRLSFALGLTAFLSLHYCFHGLSHGYHLLLYLSWISILFDVEDPLKGTSKWTFDVIMTVVLLTYFLPGLWKMVYIFKLSFTTGLQSIGYNPLGHQITSYFLHFNQYTDAGDWLVRSPILCNMAFGAVMAFQLGSFLPLFYPKWMKFWSGGAVLFHTGIYLAMGIDFKAMLAVVLFVSWQPWLKAQGSEIPASGVPARGAEDPA